MLVRWRSLEIEIQKGIPPFMRGVTERVKSPFRLAKSRSIMFLLTLKAGELWSRVV